MPRWSRRDRELYKYRPDDMTAQREAAERMKRRREEELRGIAEEFDGSIRRKLEESQPPKPAKIHVVKRRRKRSLVDDVADVVSSVVKAWTRKGRGTHRR
jgi:hypothetical protein